MRNMKLIGRKDAVVFKKAFAEDAEIFSQIHSAAWHQAYADLFEKAYLKSVTDGEKKHDFLDGLQNGEKEHYIIYKNENPIGIIVISIRSAVMEINSLYLLSNFKREGIGSKAIKYVETVAEQCSVNTIVLWVLTDNKTARKFYENQGFLLTGSEREIERGRIVSQVRYLKILK